MEIGVAQHRVDRQQSLEMVPDWQFVGRSDAAVDLDSGLRHGSPKAAGLRLQQGKVLRAGTLGLGEGSGVEQRGAQRHRRHLHVGEAMADRLEAGDGNAELLSGRGVSSGLLHKCLHRSNRLRGEREPCPVQDFGKRVRGIKRQLIVSRHGYTVEIDICGPPSIDGPIRPDGYARASGIDQDKRDFSVLALCADDKNIGIASAEDQPLLAGEKKVASFSGQRRFDLGKLRGPMAFFMG